MGFEKYKYIAHRGLHDEKQNIFENTLEAFKNALYNNYAIELDVQFTKDEKIVVFHDYNTYRMTGINKNIKDMTLEEINKIKIRKLETENSISKIPTLEEVLNLVDGKVPLLIEVKNEGKIGKLEEMLKDILKHYNGEFMLESFNPFVVRYFKKNTDFLCGLLACKYYDSLKGKLVGFFINNFVCSNLFNFDFIAYKYKELNLSLLNKLNIRKIPLFLWTIDSLNDAKEALKISDGIIFENIKF